MSARTVVFLLITRLLLTALCIMRITSTLNFLACIRIIVLTAEFFTTLKAPWFATSGPDYEVPFCG
jgi:hypothetical protein